jgi:biopolymer transport protein ExbD
MATRDNNGRFIKTDDLIEGEVMEVEQTSTEVNDEPVADEAAEVVDVNNAVASTVKALADNDAVLEAAQDAHVMRMLAQVEELAGIVSKDGEVNYKSIVKAYRLIKGEGAGKLAPYYTGRLWYIRYYGEVDAE